jgi:hypothetical protein
LRFVGISITGAELVAVLIYATVLPKNLEYILEHFQEILDLFA